MTLRADKSFISRWSDRKQVSVSGLEEASEIPIEELTEEAELPLLTDADMPPIESLTEDSDYSGFLSPKVSEALRKQALRKLFHTAEFNICDGLDDYDGDYTKFEGLGKIVTADMQHQLEMETRKRLQALAEEEHGVEIEENIASEVEISIDSPMEDAEAIVARAETEIDNDNDDAEVDL